MKRRSERVRLKRLSEMAVGEAAPVGKAGIAVDVDKASHLLPVPVAKQETQILVEVEKPNTSIPLILLAHCIFVVGLGMNGWFSYSKGVAEVDRYLFLGLGLFLDAILFYLPDRTANLWKARRYGAFLLSSTICVFLLVFAGYNNLGFASLNLAEITAIRAQRVTPEITDAQRTLDTLSASRASECLKRGDKCRQLEKDEQQASERLRTAREKVSATADPQTQMASKLASWVSLGRLNPTPNDFAMLSLLLPTLLSQIGGLVLMIARR